MTAEFMQTKMRKKEVYEKEKNCKSVSRHFCFFGKSRWKANIENHHNANAVKCGKRNHVKASHISRLESIAREWKAFVLLRIHQHFITQPIFNLA
jgi:hypothetical protein